MKLYLVRHGQSEANLSDSVSLPETPLTEKGIQDAVNAGKMLAEIKFDKILVSPYKRAIQTMQNAMPDCEFEVVDCLHEVDCGDMEGFTWKEMREKYSDFFDEMVYEDNFKLVGGESYTEVRERTREFRRYVESLGCDKVVAFAHAGFISALVDDVVGRPGKPGRYYDVNNGSVSVFEFRGGKWWCKALNITPDVLK